jgi:hypothetical protein
MTHLLHRINANLTQTGGTTPPTIREPDKGWGTNAGRRPRGTTNGVRQHGTTPTLEPSEQHA